MLDEIKVVSNQNVSVEMFLIRLLYVKNFNPKVFLMKTFRLMQNLKKI